MSIHRAPHPDNDRLGFTKNFSEHVTKELESRLSRNRKLAEQARIINAPLSALIRGDDKAMSALRELEPMIQEERDRYKKAARAVVPRAAHPFSITTNGGLIISTPPYDMWWKTGVLFAEADIAAGTFEAEAIDDSGYSAAGLGVIVSSTVPQDVRFSADAEFHSTWSDLVIEHGYCWNDGGVGVLVFEGGNTIARTDAKLWSDTQVGWQPLSGASGDNVTLLTQTAAGQTYFHMVPGRQYVVWVWCWVATGGLGEVFTGADIKVHMPFVIVEQQG